MSAIIRSGPTTDEWIIDATSKAGRVTLYDAAGRAVAWQSKNTFYASGTFTPVAAPTDLVTIFGSATKTVRVVSLRIGTTNTAAGSQQWFLVKRSAVNSGGTFVAATAVNADSTDIAATATTYGHYTANATSLGTSAGTVNTRRVASTVAVPGSFAGVMHDSSIDLCEAGAGGLGLHKPIVLNGIAQGLCINFSGAALVAGQTHCYQIIWTEE